MFSYLMNQINRRRLRQISRGVMVAAISSLFLVAASCGGGNEDGGTWTTLNEKDCALQYEPYTPVNNPGVDPQIASQWHLNNTGQLGGSAGEDLRVSDAWLTTLGENSRVAVVDDGIEVTHQDLAPNVVADASFNYRPGRRGSAYPLPCSLVDDHGTAVAGIIAARNENSLGVAGVAPRTKLVGYNALATGQDADIADALSRGLATNGVYNNSWGAPDDGVLSPADNTFVATILDGIANGRSGKGAIYVFPAGNGGCFPPGCGVENSNYDGYVNKLGIITACAVDNQGHQPFYGERGANILVCAPSSNSASYVTTTALQNKYRMDFSGTSASTPMVSGVAALMLSVNPNLSWRDVQQIMATTARKNSPTDAEWRLAFGLNYNPKFGFGVVNAQAAVAAAASWVSIGDSATLQTCGPYQATPNKALPEIFGTVVTPVQDAIAISNCNITNIEFVEIRFTADHTYGGDLRINLTSPNGLISELADKRTCAGTSGVDNCGNYDDWQFGSVRHMSEPVNGTWTLDVADAQEMDTGTFNRWSLKFYGR